MLLRNITIEVVLGGQRCKTGVRETRDLCAMNERKGWEKTELEHQSKLVERKGCTLAAGSGVLVVI